MSEEEEPEESMSNAFSLKINLENLPKYDNLDPEELQKLIKEKTNILIVDVRDSDFTGGHVPGAVNFPAQDFDKSLDKLTKKVEDGKFTQVLFYCMYCRERAPQCALGFVSSWNSKIKKERTETKDALSVCILRGGFHSWINFCNQKESKADETKISKGVEKFDSSQWSYTQNQGLLYKKDLEAEYFALGTLDAAQGSLTTPKNASLRNNFDFTKEKE
eukprot:gb/GEZN01011307.1/.p1 GENE.gb/GEZN01011307.1/~~gb/GEZN01011307.1/.p1  ORF type:complete len:218 (-),score=47.02 gb/GEZN01011307.1/:459-1112(-)